MGTLTGKILVNCKSCKWISEQQLIFSGTSDITKENGLELSFCCETGRTVVPFADTPRETLERFMGMRTMLIMDSLQNEGKNYPHCAQCPRFCAGEWSPRSKISYIAFSIYPAPCQCRCIYCTEIPKQSIPDTPVVRENFRKLLEFMEYLKDSGAVSSKAQWQISPGEITIHPYKEEIYRILKGQAGYYYTNAFLFDKGIADSLHSNPRSKINLSIDAGTAGTWKTVKGFDNFEQVLENLKRYRESSLQPGQIMFKYIILPGINDRMDEYVKMFEITKSLDVCNLEISRDNRYVRELAHKSIATDRERELEQAAVLWAMCKQNGVDPFVSDMFFPWEAEEIEKHGEIRLQEGLIE